MIVENCLFCCYPSRYEKLVIYENDCFYVIPNAFPKTPRHLLIISYKHINSFSELTAKMMREWQQAIKMGLDFLRKDFTKLYKEVIHTNFCETSQSLCQKMIEEKKEPSDHYNIITNHGEHSGQTVYHFHTHIIPRYENDNFFKNNKL